ncbi:MAG TPA: SpoIIE family protein phosphatase [Gaiellaceae bacterium]
MTVPAGLHARSAGALSPVAGTLVAIAAPAAATVICLAASLQGKPGPGAIFVLAVCVSATVGGIWSGLLAAACSYLAASWFVIEPVHSLKLDRDTGLFVVVLLLASIPIVLLLRRERQASRSAEDALAAERGLRSDLGEASDLLRDALANRQTLETRERFLAKAAEALTATLDYDLTLVNLGNLVVPGIADWCLIALLDAPEIEPDGRTGARPARSIEYGKLAPDAAAVVDRTIDLPRVIATGTPELHAGLPTEPGNLAGPSTVVVPLSVRGRRLGAIALAREPGKEPLCDDDLALAVSLARKAAVAVDNARLHRLAELARAESEISAARVRRLQTIIDAAFSSGSLDELLTQLLERLREAVGSDTATILIAEEQEEMLVVRQAVGFKGSLGLRVPFGSGFSGHIAATRTHAVVTDVQASAFHVPGRLSSGVVSLAGAPLIVDGVLVGVLQVGSRKRREFDDEDVMLLRLVAARAAISIDRARLFEREQSVAESLQRSLLPSRLPTVEGLESAARYLPGTLGLDVGGDWYDVFEFADGSVGITVGDVMGRGVQAAATMGHLRHVMRAYALEGLSPAKTLERLNHIANESDLFATVVYGVIAPSRLTMRIANAGHLPPIMRSADGTVSTIEEGRSMPLGTSAAAAFPEAVVQLESDCSLVLYTDGLVERRNESIDIGIERLISLVATCDASTANHLAEGIIEGLHVGFDPDDRALLTVRVPGTVAERMVMHFPPDPSALAAARAGLRDWLHAHGAHADEAFDIVFAVNEACSNAVEHPLDAGDSEIALEAEISSGHLTIMINDSGRWKAESTSRHRGRGLRFMNVLMENVEIVRSSDGTSVRLERELDGAPSWSAAAS